MTGTGSGEPLELRGQPEPHGPRAPAPDADGDGYPPKRPGRCNARRTVGGKKKRCGRLAGWGTDHPGYGLCRGDTGNTGGTCGSGWLCRFW